MDDLGLTVMSADDDRIKLLDTYLGNKLLALIKVESLLRVQPTSPQFKELDRKQSSLSTI